MRKLVIIILVVIVLLIGGVWLFADSLMRSAVEKSGTYALGVDTTLDSASLAPIRGHVGLKGLEIANPKGFKGPYFMRIDDAQLSVSTSSLLGDVVDAPSFVLDGLDAYLERADGHTNYGAILDSLKRLESKDKSGDKGKPSEGGGKKFIVRDVRLRNLRVHTDFLPELGELSKVAVTIPEVHLTDVGNAEGGASISELVGALVQAVLQAAVESGAAGLPKSLLNDISASLSQLDAQVFKDIEKQLGKGLGGAGKALNDLGKGLEKIFK